MGIPGGENLNSPVAIASTIHQPSKVRADSPKGPHGSLLHQWHLGRHGVQVFVSPRAAGSFGDHVGPYFLTPMAPWGDRPTSPPAAPFRKSENRGTGGSKCRSGCCTLDYLPCRLHVHLICSFFANL